MNLKSKAQFFLTILALAGAAISGYAQSSKSAENRAIEDQFVHLKAENGESHASGARKDLGPVIMGNPQQAVVFMRVGLFANTFNGAGVIGTEFSTLHHQTVSISNTVGTANIVNLSNGSTIASMTAGEIYTVSYDGTNYIVTGPDTVPHPVTGPIRFTSANTDNLFRVDSILRANILGGAAVKPTYRGEIEINRSTATQANRVNVVNIVEVEKYVRGVVVNESIASFHIEALKTQATAARGYAIANVGNYVNRGYPFDIVDSSSSQVYRGVASEHVRAIQSTEETTGLVASYNGQIISALYSSSFGGYSDSNQWTFSSAPPGPAVFPYLTGIYDGEGAAPDLSDPTAMQAFYSSTDQTLSYDMCGRVNNRFARWRIEVPATDIKARLNATTLVATTGDTSGAVSNVEVIQRAEGSNRISRVRISFVTGGTGEVRGWDNVRAVIGRNRSAGTSPGAPCGSTTIAANFTLNAPSFLEPYNNGDGSFGGVWANGAGWGHNVGMSQYGGHGRASAGQNFLQILKTYYQGVDVGSYPVRIGHGAGSSVALVQNFFVPFGSATVEVRNATAKRLLIRINDEKVISLLAHQLGDGSESIDISKYVKSGVNKIEYTVISPTGNASVNVNVN